MSENIDYIYGTMIGSGGKGQWKLFIYSLPVTLAMFVPLLMDIFSTLESKHRCFIPHCENEISSSPHNFDMDHYFLDFSIPPSEISGSNFLQTVEGYDACLMYQPLSPSCQSHHFNSSQLISCSHGYIYDNKDMDVTLTTELDLVCHNDHYRRLLTPVMMAGLTLGSLLGGTLGDKFGRKLALFGALLIACPCVILGGFAGDFTTYAILRFLLTTSLPIMWISNYNLLVEYLDPANRKLFMTMRNSFFPLSQILMITFSYFFRHWTWFHVAIGAFMSLTLPLYFVIPESVRWLVINNRREEAMTIIVDMAKQNGRNLSRNAKTKILNILENVDRNTNNEKLNMTDMFIKRQRLKTFILMFNWITVCVGSYTLTLNSVALYGDVRLNFIIACVCEIPVDLILFLSLDKLGRRFCLFVLQFIVGLSCIVLAFVPKDYPFVVMFLFILCKGACGGCFFMVWLIPAEMYPTNLRSQAMGIFSTVARIFGSSSSFVGILAVYWKPLPFLVLGLPSLFAGISVFALPETAGKDLPQTIEDAIALQQEKPDSRSSTSSV